MSSLFFLLSFLGITQAAMDGCDTVKAEYNLCTNEAYWAYQKAFDAGDDGRPDWMARKSCNYMTAAVEECSNMLVGKCNTCEEVIAMKDEQMKRVLKNVRSYAKEWNTDKCPATKAHAARMKALEKGETIEASCKTSIEEEIDDDSGRASTASEAANKNCSQITKEFNQCTKSAYEEFMNAVRGGDDGRPDWLARKSCNYMTAAIEDCGDMLVGKCNTCEEVTKMKDEQMKMVLKNLKTSVKEWDSNKCPASKAHMGRMLALENGEKIEATCNFEDVPGLVTETALTAFTVSFMILPFFV